MLVNLKEKIWNEKYRPQIIEDCIIPETLKKNFENFVIAQDCPNLMLHSQIGGTGKTTVLKALCHQLDFEYLFINASEQRSIDVLRNEITQFVSTLSLEGRNKAVLFDEFDNSQQITQNALRSFIEQYSKVRFFFSCNYIDKIIQPLQSRCTVISYDWKKEDEKYLKNKFFNRVKQILINEKIEFKKDVVVELIQQHFPDFRRIINELQKYSITGVIDEGLLSYSAELNLKVLFDALKEKNFTKVREFIETNDNLNYELFYKNFKKELKEIADVKCIPQCILILGNYMHRHSTVLDKSINALCCMIEVMSEIKFK